MRFHPLYEALMDGRYQPAIDILQDGEGNYLARYTDVHGVTLEATDTNRAEATRRCVDAVREAVREGTITPGHAHGA